ncbi:MAG: protease inhibitor I42 family protein [Mycobacterium sp.]
MPGSKSPYNDLLNQKRVHRDIDLAAGQTLRVILGANASTGYRWTEDAQISDTAVLVQTGHVAIASPTAGPACRWVSPGVVGFRA